MILLINKQFLRDEIEIRRSINQKISRNSFNLRKKAVKFQLLHYFDKNFIKEITISVLVEDFQLCEFNCCLDDFTIICRYETKVTLNHQNVFILIFSAFRHNFLRIFVDL